MQAGESLRVCLAATVSADMWGVRRELLPWLQYHTQLGASHFYVGATEGGAVCLLNRERERALLCASAFGQTVGPLVVGGRRPSSLVVTQKSPPSPLPQLLYDGHDAEAVQLLESVRHVTLIHIQPPWANPADDARWRLYAASAGEASSRQWGGQPGNFELMVKQG